MKIEAIGKKTKVLQIQEQIRDLVRAGTLPPGGRLQSERELASKFNVSAMTVNKAMAGLESEGLLMRAPGKGTYVRKSVDRGLVAVVLSSHLLHWPSGGAFWESMMGSLSGLLSTGGFRPMCMISQGIEREDVVASLHPDSPIWQHLTGAITHTPLGKLGTRMLAEGKPVVEMGDHNWPYRVSNDYRAFGVKAAQHLLARGSRRIGMIYRGPRPHPDLVEGMATAMGEHGLTFDPDLLVRAEDAVGGRGALRQLLSRLPRPDAVVISDDSLAHGVAEDIVRLRLEVPEQLAVLTHATTCVPREFPLPYTTCQFDVDRLSRALYGLFERLLRNGQMEPVTVRCKPRLVIGGTT